MKMFQEVGTTGHWQSTASTSPILHRYRGCLNHKLQGCDTMIECATASHTSRMVLGATETLADALTKPSAPTLSPRACHEQFSLSVREYLIVFVAGT